MTLATCSELRGLRQSGQFADAVGLISQLLVVSFVTLWQGLTKSHQVSPSLTKSHQVSLDLTGSHWISLVSIFSHPTYQDHSRPMFACFTSCRLLLIPDKFCKNHGCSWCSSVLRQGTGICLVGVLFYNWTKAQQPSPRPLESWRLLNLYAFCFPFRFFR